MTDQYQSDGWHSPEGSEDGMRCHHLLTRRYAHSFLRMYGGGWLVIQYYDKEREK
jgi:hypothetical protein